MSERKKYSRSRRGTSTQGSATTTTERVQSTPPSNAAPTAPAAPRRKVAQVQPAQIVRRAAPEKPNGTASKPAPEQTPKAEAKAAQPAQAAAARKPRPAQAKPSSAPPQETAAAPQPAAKSRAAPDSDQAKPIRPRRPEKPVVLPTAARTDVTPPLILTPEDMPPAQPEGAAERPLSMPDFKGKAAPNMPQPVTPVDVPQSPPVARGQSDIWRKLATMPLSADHLERNRIISATRRDPAHTAFDVLRTRLLQVLDENDWTRVAITSPTKDCGKTFVAANLALSMSRQEACRTLLLDMDLRAPSLARVLGAANPSNMGDFLRGTLAAEDYFLRFGDDGLSVGRNIAVGLNATPEGYASELLQLPDTAQVLDRMHQALSPDVVLYDMPPALFHDDVMAFRPHIDGVLLVIGGGITTASEVKEVERRLGDATPLLGVIMNKAEGPTVTTYSY